jgi:hypothetical protein
MCTAAACGSPTRHDAGVGDLGRRMQLQTARPRGGQDRHGAPDTTLHARLTTPAAQPPRSTTQLPRDNAWPRPSDRCGSQRVVAWCTATRSPTSRPSIPGTHAWPPVRRWGSDWRPSSSGRGSSEHGLRPLLVALRRGGDVVGLAECSHGRWSH